MPELPEVETIRRILTSQISGLTITTVNVYGTNTIEGDKDTFIKSITGTHIISIDRRGKYFIFNVDGGKLIIHLRMNGQLYVTSNNEKPTRYTLITFTLSDGRILFFDDKRKFAKAYFLSDSSDNSSDKVMRLGLEPFDSELTPEYLKKWWRYNTNTVKGALLDQDIVAGFGNFYSDELLFVCGIYPKKKCNNLTDYEYDLLVKNMPEVMNWGIESDNITAEEYDKMRGTAFHAKSNSYVYGRSGRPCKVCDTRIESITINGRTCCFCPTCQPVSKIKTNGGDKTMNGLTPEIFAEVAQYIGASISAYGHFDIYSIPDTDGKSITGKIKWEDFIMFAHEYINIRERINTDYGNDVKEQWDVRTFIKKRINSGSFELGLNWIKSQNWAD